MADPTMNTANSGSMQRPTAYGGKAVGKAKKMRTLTSKRKVSVKQ